MTNIIANHKWDKKCHATDKKIQNKRKSHREDDENNEKPNPTGQLMTQSDKKPEKKACFECREGGHIAPNYPYRDKPKSEWWINKQSRVSPHQKARCVELAELKTKNKKNKLNNQTKKTQVRKR